MLTYLNDAQLKVAFLAEITKHEEQDALIKGTYGRSGAGGGSGVAGVLRGAGGAVSR